MEAMTPWKRRLVVVGSVVIIPSFVYAYIPFEGSHWELGLLFGLAAAMTVVPITIFQAKKIARSDRPLVDASIAICLVLVLLIFGFASIYYSFAVHSNQMFGIKTRIDSVYFTITTLGTVGYGDIHPAGQAARVVASIQMLFDLLVIGVAVRVISSAATQKKSQLTGGHNILK